MIYNDNRNNYTYDNYGWNNPFCRLSVWQSASFNLPINKYYDIINYYVIKEWFRWIILL